VIYQVLKYQYTKPDTRIIIPKYSKEVDKAELQERITPLLEHLRLIHSILLL